MKIPGSNLRFSMSLDEVQECVFCQTTEVILKHLHIGAFWLSLMRLLRFLDEGSCRISAALPRVPVVSSVGQRELEGEFRKAMLNITATAQTKVSKS